MYHEHVAIMEHKKETYSQSYVISFISILRQQGNVYAMTVTNKTCRSQKRHNKRIYILGRENGAQNLSIRAKQALILIQWRMQMAYVIPKLTLM